MMIYHVFKPVGYKNTKLGQKIGNIKPLKTTLRENKASADDRAETNSSGSQHFNRSRLGSEGVVLQQRRAIPVPTSSPIYTSYTPKKSSSAPPAQFNRRHSDADVIEKTAAEDDTTKSRNSQVKLVYISFRN